MAFLDDIYLSEETESATFYQKVETTDINTGITTESFPEVLTANGLFWTGSMAEAYVSDRYKAIVSAAFIMNYSDYLKTTGNISTIAFPTSTTITDSSNGFIIAGFKVGQSINIVTEDGTNDGVAIITGVLAGTLTCAASNFTIQIASVVGVSSITMFIKKDSKVIINSKTYGVIYINNVAEQNQVIEIPLKEYT